MNVDHLDQLAELEETYWWHIAKRDLILNWLKRYLPAPASLVEGGIGSCGNLHTFQAEGYQVTGLDIMPEAVKYGKDRGIESLWVHDLQTPWPEACHQSHGVILLDVIEHTQDPVSVLKHANQAMNDGGILLLTVPAYQWLYGDWDKALGHYRRYTLNDLLDETFQAGFKPLKTTFWNSFTLPAAIGVRTYQKWTPQQRQAEFPNVSKPVNRILSGLAGLERGLMKISPIPCGLSIAGIFRKCGEITV